MKHAIYSDVDGTIYSHEQTYHKDTKESIKKAQDKGIEFILCTGNPFFEKMQLMSKELNVDYFIGSNGAFIYDVKNENELMINSMTKEEGQEILDIINDLEIGADWWDTNTLYANEFLISEFKEMINNSISDSKKLIIQNEINDGVHKIEVYTKDIPSEISKINELELRLKGKDVQIARMDTFHLEITKNNVSKGTAVIELSKYLEIPKENIMTIGDSSNDHSMFEVTDYSYAMGNADDSTKKLANYHTSTVKQNGLGEAIIDFMFRKRLTSNFDNQK